MAIREVTRRAFKRVGAHSHIRGLGLEGLKAKKVGDGMIGQEEAREAAGILVRMIKEGKMAGRAILLAGPPGTGKTAIAVAISRELGEDVPFVQLSGSEIYSSEMKKTEVLMQALRKAIGVRIHEIRKVYEGEVRNLNVKFTKHPYNPYYRVPESVTITLRTLDEEKTLEASAEIAEEIIGQDVRIGDVIQIDAETGRVIKLGVSKQAESKRYDIDVARGVQVPSGPVLKEKEFVYTVTLHDLDVMRVRSGSIFSLLFGGGETKEIDERTRREVDQLVKNWVEEGKAEIIPGVLFIDEVHMLDIEAFSFLARAMESELAPIIILASNRGLTKIRGTDITSPHGIPLDLLDRLLIINTRPYTPDEIREILKVRAKEEGVKLTDEALEYLTKIGAETSLRYAVQLLTPAYEVAKENEREEVTKSDVERVRRLFADVKTSTEYLREFEEKMMK